MKIVTADIIYDNRGSITKTLDMVYGTVTAERRKEPMHQFFVANINKAISVMKSTAVTIGADAVVSVKIDIQKISDNTFEFTVYGTAVITSG